MLCFSVESKDSLENIESKWVGEIAENHHVGPRLEGGRQEKAPAATVPLLLMALLAALLVFRRQQA